MARRSGRKGDYLATDDYTGFTVFASKLQRDFWGSMAVNPLQRNLQEISSPLNDPQPVPMFRGPTYETYPTICLGAVAPLYVGTTNVLTNQNNAAFQALNLHPGLGSMEVGCSFFVS